MALSDLLTVDDLIRARACRDGVIDWRDKHAPGATAISVETALATGIGVEYIERAAGLVGNNNGYGHENVYGNGFRCDGYGHDYDEYGDCYGNGDGYGFGYGFGDRYGNGDGDGCGYAYIIVDDIVDGDGYCLGDDDGDGYGLGIGSRIGDGHG